MPAGIEMNVRTTGNTRKERRRFSPFGKPAVREVQVVRRDQNIFAVPHEERTTTGIANRVGKGRTGYAPKRSHDARDADIPDRKPLVLNQEPTRERHDNLARKWDGGALYRHPEEDPKPADAAIKTAKQFNDRGFQTPGHSSLLYLDVTGHFSPVSFAFALIPSGGPDRARPNMRLRCTCTTTMPELLTTVARIALRDRQIDDRGEDCPAERSRSLPPCRVPTRHSRWAGERKVPE